MIVSCEDGVCLEEFRPVEELLALIASLTFLGKAELKVALCVTNPQPPGFKFDPPLTKGRSSLCQVIFVVILCLTRIISYYTTRMNNEPPLQMLTPSQLISITCMAQQRCTQGGECPFEKTPHTSSLLCTFALILPTPPRPFP